MHLPDEDTIFSILAFIFLLGMALTIIYVVTWKPTVALTATQDEEAFCNQYNMSASNYQDPVHYDYFRCWYIPSVEKYCYRVAQLTEISVEGGTGSALNHTWVDNETCVVSKK